MQSRKIATMGALIDPEQHFYTSGKSPAFAREASEGCRAEPRLGEGGHSRELRLGTPSEFAYHR
jgi:hypothetical protein